MLNSRSLLLVLSGCAALSLTGCVEDDGPGYSRTSSRSGYYGDGDRVDFVYQSGRPYSREYGPLVVRSGRHYYTRGGTSYVYNRPTYSSGSSRTYVSSSRPTYSSGSSRTVSTSRGYSGRDYDRDDDRRVYDRRDYDDDDRRRVEYRRDDQPRTVYSTSRGPQSTQYSRTSRSYSPTREVVVKKRDKDDDDD